MAFLPVHHGLRGAMRNDPSSFPELLWNWEELGKTNPHRQGLTSQTPDGTATGTVASLGGFLGTLCQHPTFAEAVLG